MTAEQFLEERRPRVEAELERLLGASLADVPGKLAEAMRYGVLGGGKRLRPALAMAAAEAVVPASVPSALRYGCALELVHGYSLIHDDLPAMDDDDLRRGRPTVHKAFGEATAILAGDALLTLAFEWTAELGGALGAALCLELARGAGAVGMVGGQALDIEATGRRDLPAEAIEHIHRGKTSGLMAAATAGGALCAGASAADAARLRRYGEALGLAFQAADDYLDVVADPAARGKRQGGDEAEDKATLVRALGLDGARARAEAHAEAACAQVAALPGGGLLRELALYAARRTR
ncbi:MAG: polyprenyl synthetase family protein [Myxococcales bacterium]